MPNLSSWVETGWWALAIQGGNFWCFSLMTWLIFFQQPFTLGSGEGCLTAPRCALTPDMRRLWSWKRWRQKPKKSIGPVSQGRGGRLLKTQSRHVFAAWCGSTAHLRTHWISPSLIYLFIWLCFTLHFTSFLGGGESLILKVAQETGVRWVVRSVLHDFNGKNSLETIWIVRNK